MADRSFLRHDEFYKQSQWIMLTRELAAYFDAYDYTGNFGERAHIPDEHYFVCVATKFNLPFENAYLTYTEWVGDSDRPVSFSMVGYGKIEGLRSQGYLFMRKVPAACKIPKRLAEEFLITA